MFVDRKQAESAQKQALRLLAVTAGALYELAGADGRYTVKEDKVIRAILAEMNHNLGAKLSAHELAFLIDDASRIDRSLARLAATVRGNPPLARAAVSWLWRVAVSDSDDNREEAACITAFAHHAGLPEEELRHTSALYTRHASAASDKDRCAACTVLGVPYDADAAALKAAYRTLSQKYHPDKHAALDPDIRALTSDKFAQIKNAYDTLSGHAGLDWFARQADTGRLVPAAAEAAVCCFACSRKSHLPAAEHLSAARCPTCQTLLVFERGLAEQLV
jgi:DnaJ-domain-containing protein 1